MLHNSVCVPFPHFYSISAKETLQTFGAKIQIFSKHSDFRDLDNQEELNFFVLGPSKASKVLLSDH